jgi:dimethylhistidine N-methyltransferase
LNSRTANDTFAADVARDLQKSPKQLQSQYLYDALGISLFEAICRLPWYRITRAEEALLARHAGRVATILDGETNSIIELGVGSGEKLARLLDGVPAGRATQVHLVDISASALEATAVRLAKMRHVSLWKHHGTYEQGLEAAAMHPAFGGRKLVLFLGSNIGNFDPASARHLLGAIRSRLAPGDFLLLGADLVKPEADLILAYDDPLGVTAAFNKNLLLRINRELDADFPLEDFDHRAVWEPRTQRIEMHLVSRQRQTVEIRAIDLRVSFEAGESIWTESSYKYTEAAIEHMGAAAGFSIRQQWIDGDARFALTLLVAG